MNWIVFFVENFDMKKKFFVSKKLISVKIFFLVENFQVFSE